MWTGWTVKKNLKDISRSDIYDWGRSSEKLEVEQMIENRLIGIRKTPLAPEYCCFWVISLFLMFHLLLPWWHLFHVCLIFLFWHLSVYCHLLMNATLSKADSHWRPGTGRCTALQAHSYMHKWNTFTPQKGVLNVFAKMNEGDATKKMDSRVDSWMTEETESNLNIRFTAVVFVQRIHKRLHWLCEF